MILSIGVRAPWDLGGGDLIAQKKLHNSRNRESCLNTLKSQYEQKRSQFSRLMILLSLQK